MATALARCLFRIARAAATLREMPVNTDPCRVNIATSVKLRSLTRLSGMSMPGAAWKSLDEAFSLVLR